jgi:hypothetical protein
MPLSAGSLSGVVVDALGAVIPNSKVTVLGENGEQVETKTNQVGRFVFADIKPGTYSIEVYSPGFLDKRIQGFQVRIGEETALPAITLSVAAIVGECAGPFPPAIVYTPIPSGLAQLSGRAFLAGNNRGAGALILLYDPKSHRKVGSAVADSHGDFLVTGLRPGLYQLRVRLNGFAELVMEGVEIRSGYRSGAEYFSLTPCPRRGACPAVKWVSAALCL